MWVYNDDYNRWENTTDKLTLSDYELLKQELSSVRFYSKCLSGATYVPVHNLDDIYDILGKYKPRNWYLSTNATQYSNTGIPAQFATPITATTSYDYYTKYLTEYGLTLKNLFTPNRLIKDSINNYVTVDLATTEQLVDLTVRNTNRIIDGVKVINGHRVLVKDQRDLVTLANTENPDDYFLSPYTVVQNFGATIAYETASLANGIYVYRDGDLIREPDLEEYENCKRYSVVVKSGATNFDKQFHLVRLLNGYFPTTSKSEPIQFIESKNWILRHRVDYNNLFEINYYDVVKYPTQSYHIDGITYSIPERTIAVGEFGIINNTQEGISNIIYNKYKVNLRSITQTKRFYFICGDDGILLKVRKHDFSIQRLILPTTNNLRSVSFFDDLKGVVVGDLNTVYVTENEGVTWNRLRIGAFDPYYFTKVIYHSPNGFYTSGNVGIFVEFKRDIYGWSAFKRRISRFIDDDDEYLLVDNINDIHYTTTTTWGLSYSYLTQSIPVDKAMIFIVTDDSKIILHDINGFTNFNFLYLDFPNKYGDIRNITRKFQTNEFYFTGIDESTGNEGLYSFSLDNFQYIGVGNSYSNTISATISAVWESEIYGNEIFDYFAQDLIVAGNESLYKSSTYSTSFNFQVLDPNFESRLKSKLLFLDYDAGSKLNFFTDFGDYRLPNPAILPTSLSNLSFSPLVYGPTGPSFMTQSEINWFKYWQDGRMTFEYYTINPTTDTTKVLISPSFSYSSVQAELSISSVTYDVNDIINLAPTISDKGHSRFYAIGLTAISAPTASYDLYLYDYLMILKTSTSYAVSNGDVMRLSSDVVTDNFIVNKIVDFGPDRYIYMFSEFNQNIITALSSSTNITITNLNSFLTTDELLERFNIHPISNGYELSYTEQNVVNQLLMDFSNGGVTSSYTNWIFSGGFTTSANFPTSPVISAPYTSSPYSYLTTGVGDNFIETPEVYGIENISFSYRSTTGNYSPSLTFSSITVQGLSGSNWIDINTATILDGFAGGLPYTASFSVAGEYSKFRFNLRTSSTSPSFLAPLNYKPVRIDDLKLMGDDGLYIDENSYGTSREDIDRLKVDPKFNNLTAYYNLATNVFVDSLTYSMVYTDGFLKFGYTPTYNLIDYLESINEAGDPNPKFYATKEYYVMPDLRDIPMPGINSFTFSTAYIDYNGMTAAIGLIVSNRQDNKILFGTDLKAEWDSIFINTFVDINLYATSSVTTTERALVTKKYSIFDEINSVDYYVVEFHKRLNYVLNDPLYKLDIISRRKLLQISEDLQQLNLIQRPTKSNEYLAGANSNIWTADFTSYQREMNFKVNTDSYAKILLSDDDTIQSMSAILYTDFKNELAMNITRLGKEVTVPILNTANFAGNLFISCSEKHGLKDEEGVVLEFFGGTGSSQTINQQYFGYHPIKKVNEYNFYINFPYGNTPLVGNDIGYVKYTRQDPFLNYLPIDLIDVGVDKRGKIALELTAENTLQSGETYSLVNVDFGKYRFRLVDGLNIETLALNYPWIYEAEISGAVIGQLDSDLIWYKGTWECGRWFGGTWQSGLWKSGDWYGGTWNSKLIDDNYINVQVDDNSNGPSYSTWINGRWYDGTWNNGIWSNGRWYGGTWSNGTWYKGIWNDGLWLNGNFNGGIWVLGTWQSGIFNTNNEPAYWIDGYWYGGDFENGMWYSGVFDQKFQESRFGTNAYNSRTATWHGGKWVNGSFHSRMNINDDGQYDVSDVHKYSIWYTGQWFRGDFYGGIAYNMDFKSGTWHGGILEDIQIIGLTGSTASSENYFTLNGIFKFNIGDEISIIDNQIGNTYSLYGSNQNPQDYTVLYTVEDSINKRTNVYVNRTITLNATSPMDVGIRVVSRFGNCDWKSGIWTNGLFNSGIWQGGIWYNGVFSNDATWM